MICVLDISYFGEPFSGFARQPGQLTVQGSIEDALLTIFSTDIETTCAGRTDAGVHAKHQFVSFELPKNDVEVLSLKKSLEQLSHDDIHINNVEIKEGDFSARFDAKQRHYSYFICNQEIPSLFMRNFSWHYPKPLDINLMNEAAEFLIGEHDFKSFCVAASARDKSTMRNISKIKILPHEISEDNIIEIQISGNAFLHSMVRTIVGSLVKIGNGSKPPAWMQEVLVVKDRQKAGECAPAHGLVLMDVDY